VHNARVPRVTVFIPTYNRAKLLAHSIRGVLEQTFDDLRLVVSDNASEDETPEVVTSFDDPRLEYVRQPRNLGLLGNHNWFLARVETDYALILADDDLVYPTLLERAVPELDRRARTGVVHAAFDVIDEEGEVLLPHVNWTYGLEHDSVESPEEFIRESMRWSCRICASTAVMRTAALPPGGMVQQDFPAIDFGLWLRTAGAGWEFAFLNETLGAYRVHGTAQSAAFSTPQGPGYVQGIEIASHLKAIKLRFLAEADGRLPDTKRLRRLAEDARRRELVVMARNLTLPERKPGPTFRALAQAVRADPGVVLGAPPWKLAAGSLVGPRLVEWVKRRSSPRGR
jgi:glycosyltransferase involved in cell wall biosynthesis